jgi:hypothetical protein
MERFLIIGMLQLPAARRANCKTHLLPGLEASYGRNAQQEDPETIKVYNWKVVLFKFHSISSILRRGVPRHLIAIQETKSTPGGSARHEQTQCFFFFFFLNNSSRKVIQSGFQLYTVCFQAICSV